MLQGLGYTDVATLLNSGNAVFTSAGPSAPQHARAIGAALAQSMGVHVSVVVKSAAELAAAVVANPMPVPAQDHARFLVVWAQDPAALEALASLQALVQPPERLVVGAQAAYLHCAAGILESKVGAALLGRAGQGITTRNWATALKLLALCHEGVA